MRRIFTEQILGDTHVLTQDAHKHLSIVLRAKKGQKVVLCDGSGNVFDGEVSVITHNSTTIRILGKKLDECEPRICCDLFLGLIKGSFLDAAVQKSVELGVNSVRPLLTKNTVKTDLNLERVNRIAHEAAKQCGRGRVPKIHETVKFFEILNELREYDLVVFPYEKAETVGVREFLEGVKQEIGRVAVVIGPEGGFTDDEAEGLSKFAVPISLGGRILRADTAAATTISLVMYRFGELSRRAL